MPDARGACRAYDWGLVQSFPAPRKLLPPLRRSPSLEEGGLGEGNRAFVECRRARDARPYNVAENCNCEMRLQRWVASLQRLDAFATVGCTAAPVGARIARPFIPDVITTLREGARRVLGATAKPLYAIDGKAGGLDRRTPQTSLLEGGGPPAGGGRSKRAPLGLGD